MDNLSDIEKKINSELASKIKKTDINHEQLYIEIEKETCDFPATKEGIVEFFNENAWHWQYGDPE